MADSDLRARPAGLFMPSSEAAMPRRMPVTDVAARVAAARAADDVASALAKDGGRALGAAASAVLLVGEGGTITLAAQVGLPPDVAHRWRAFSLASGSIVAEAARTGELDVVEGVALSAVDPVLAGFERQGARSLALVPCLANGRTLAVAVYAFDVARPLDDEDRGALVTLARFAAQALERARLSTAEQEARRSLEEAMRQSSILVELTSSLSRAATAEDLANAVVEHAAAALPVASVSLWRKVGGEQRLVLVGGVGDPGIHHVEGSAGLDQATPLCDAVATAEPVWITSRREAVRRYYGAVDEMGDELAVAALPLVVEGRVIGGLSFVLRGRWQFTPQERGFFLVFARHVAQSLDRARLFDDERRMRARARVLNKELRKRIHEAKEAVRVRDEFLSIASHELKTPVTSVQLQIEGAMRRLRNGPPDAAETEKLQARLRSAEEGIERLTRLVDDLLDVSRIQAGRLELEPDDCDLAALAADVVKRFESEAARAGSTLAVDAARAVVGTWDRLRLDQVLTNLVSNAIKYGGGAPIDVVVEGDERWGRVRVVDRGIGIRIEDADRVFSRFERLVSARSYGGFGLGLWICRRIVEEHGGHIAFASELGAGTTFSVALPRGR